MTYLAGSAQSLVTDRNTWQGRANTAWGSSRVWNSGSSFETDLANMTTDRNNWQTNANNAWGPSRAYGSGSSFETLYNNQVAAYNALVAGLNNPDGDQSVGVSYPSLPTNSTTAVTTLTFARAGHFAIGAYIDGSVNLNSFGAGVTLNWGGVASGSKTTNGWTNTGSAQFHSGFMQHIDVSAGQVLQVSVTTAFIASGSASGLIYAHFVPNATYHN